MVFIITFASMLFSWFVRSLLLFDFFVSTSIFFPVQPMIFDPPFNPEESAWFTFSLLTSWSNQGVRIKSARFVRELLSPFLTVMVYKTTASGLNKPALYPNMAVQIFSYCRKYELKFFKQKLQYLCTKAY